MEANLPTGLCVGGGLMFSGVSHVLPRKSIILDSRYRTVFEHPARAETTMNMLAW